MGATGLTGCRGLMVSGMLIVSSGRGTCDNYFEVAISLHRNLYQVHHSQLGSADSYGQ